MGFVTLNSSKRRKVMEVSFILLATSFLFPFPSLPDKAESTSPPRSLEVGGSATVPQEMAGRCFQPSLLLTLFYSTMNSVSNEHKSSSITLF